MKLQEVNELVGRTFRSVVPGNWTVVFNNGEYTLANVKENKVLELGVFAVYKTKSSPKGTVKFLYNTDNLQLMVSYNGGKKLTAAVNETVTQLVNTKLFSSVQLVSECGE